MAVAVAGGSSVAVAVGCTVAVADGSAVVAVGEAGGTVSVAEGAITADVAVVVAEDITLGVVAAGLVAVGSPLSGPLHAATSSTSSNPESRRWMIAGEFIVCLSSSNS